MSDLCWKLPVVSWSAIQANASADIGFIDAMTRRRLSQLSRMALKVAHDCIASCDDVRVVFASRHGELARTTDILKAITAHEPVSPTAFSLAVLNGMTGVLGIARGDRTPATAISAGLETLGYGLLEAYAQSEEDASSPVLLVYADEPADPLYGAVDREVTGGALALLLDRHRAQSSLMCRIQKNDKKEQDALGGDENEDLCATQSEAVQRCLETHRPARWRANGTTWYWSWHGVAV